jgi:hypothetical protein
VRKTGKAAAGREFKERHPLNFKIDEAAWVLQLMGPIF